MEARERGRDGEMENQGIKRERKEEKERKLYINRLAGSVGLGEHIIQENDGRNKQYTQDKFTGMLRFFPINTSLYHFMCIM